MTFLVVRRRMELACALLVAPLVIASCTGTIEPGSGTPGTGAVTGTGASGSGGGIQPGTGGGGLPGSGGEGSLAGSGGGGPVGTGGTIGPIAESAGPFVLKRLTHREYRNTLKDLLNNATDVVIDWSPDTESDGGFVTPTGVAMLTAQHYIEAADIVVDTALAQNRIIIPCTNPATAAAETTCATQFISTFGKRAYRRPVTPAESTDLMGLFTVARATPLAFDFKTSIAQVVKAMVQSPNFLYHWELGPTKPVKQGALVTLTPHQIASRLSYFLWETMPDDALLTAADMGQLSTPDQIFLQAQRLLADKTRTRNALFNFHEQWLQYENLDQLQKSPTTYPLFNDTFRATIEPEVTNFVASVILDGDGTLKSLLTAPYAFANQTTAPVYGATATGPALTRINLNATQRAGILTQSGFLATNGAPSGSHPVKRGVVIWKKLLCGQVGAVPANVPDLPEPAPNVTTRQRFEAMHSASPCATACHSKFDPLGFAFENYDGIGAYRTTDANQPVDAKGTGKTPGGTSFSFNNAVELTNFLAGNDEVKACVNRNWFRYLLGRKEVAADEGSIQIAGQQANAVPGYSIRDLVLAATKTMAFRMRAPIAGIAGEI